MKARTKTTEVLLRLPIMGIAGIYGVLYWLAPSQITDVIATTRLEGSVTPWIAFLAPPIVAALVHLVVLGSRTRVQRLPDAVLANLPLLALTAMTARSAPEALWFMIPVLVLSFAACLLLTPIFNAAARRTDIVVSVGTLAVLAVAVASILFSPVTLPTLIGPLGVVTAGIGLMGLLVAIISMYPRLAGMFLVVCVAAVFLEGPPRALPLFDASTYETGTDYPVTDGLIAWLDARGDLQDYRDADRPYPVIVASSEGGGIYAAAHSYLALSAMQGVCPSFAQHLFAAVGVSGGGVGHLLYSASVDGRDSKSRLEPCHPRTDDIDLSPLTTDLLSPVVANLLFVQVAEFLIPGPQLFPDGGDVLAGAIGTMVPTSVVPAEPLRASWKPDTIQPALIFIATDAVSGNRFVISALGASGATNAESFPSGNIVSVHDISTSTAAVASARFPWLTATARLKVSENSYRVLADGGYFENSGADTVIDLVGQIKSLAYQTQNCGDAEYSLNGSDACKCPLIIETRFDAPVEWQGCSRHIFLAYMPISGHNDRLPGYVYEDEPAPPQSYVFDPLSTMLQTREARGLLALDRARSYFGGLDDPSFVQGTGVDFGFFPHQVPIQALKLPLGWKLSENAATAILDLSAPTEACGLSTMVVDEPALSPPAAETARSPEAPLDSGSVDNVGLSQDPTVLEAAANDNGCNMKMLAALFNPRDLADAYAIKGW
ncbi:hypothetical protein ASD04_17425 [Devosia sp. Root436]|uniref:hypothetical protein n=1 Tax=Devosia sp. Root436 TaxID=1736537 RepID=UPI0006F92FBB|nr:hypothetical protein [Devosia sp. Root436]KQX34023.1 hypothetical protein ASD04_17425 [Devosia sp. Root436]